MDVGLKILRLEHRVVRGPPTVHSPTYFCSQRTNRVRDIEHLAHRIVLDQAPNSAFEILPPHSVALITSEDGLDDQETTLVDLDTGAVSVG